MKNWFFYQDRGKTVGPVTIEEVKTRIREGRIQLFDMIHVDGSDGWKMAMEFPELRAEFKTSKLQTLKDRPWVVLQRRSEKSLDFGTSGPFSTEEVRTSIASGAISYSDYAWKEGYAEWKRIGTIGDFNRRLLERKEEKAKEVLPPLPDLQNIVELKRPKAIAPPPPPPESSGPDLTDKRIEGLRALEEIRAKEEARRKQEAKLKEELAKVSEKPAFRPLPPPAEEDIPASEEVTATNIKPIGKKSRRFVDWGVVLALMLVLGAVSVGVTRYMKRTPKPQVEEPVVETSKQKSPEPKPVLPAPKPEPTIPDTPPTELTLNVETASSTQVKIEIRSDSGPSFPIFVQIIGLPGQVAEGPSFYRYLKFTPTGDPGQPIDLSDVKLPQGKFILRAQSGNLTKEARMSIGVNETAFKQAVGRLRKVHSAAIWRERLNLFSLAQILEKQVTEAAGGRPFSGKGLASLNGVKRSSGANYILFEQWFELKEIMDAAKTNASASLLARAKQARERISNFSVWK